MVDNVIGKKGRLKCFRHVKVYRAQESEVVPSKIISNNDLFGNLRPHKGRSQ